MTKKFNKKGDSNGTDSKENEYYKKKKEITDYIFNSSSIFLNIILNK